MQVTLTLTLAPKVVREWTLELPETCTVAQALSQVDWAADLNPDTSSELALSVWGRKADERTALRNGDRIELTRPLRVDPKVARRERFQRQGVRTAGLFARRTQP